MNSPAIIRSLATARRRHYHPAHNEFADRDWVMSEQATVERDDSGVVLAKADDPVMVPGRRDFLQYRELGVTKASEGKIRAQITSASQGLSEETGWHIHRCEGQFVYMLSGWVDLVATFRFGCRRQHQRLTYRRAYVSPWPHRPGRTALGQATTTRLAKKKSIGLSLWNRLAYR